uniref:Nuclear receptor domain-containing protein n=1 Tax=Meloidogyne hapla TaxID=6305 RepID=A0A1I8B9M6_MELHA
MQGFVKNCKICGSIKNVCHQYGVRTCRACGEFFTYLMQFIKKNSKLNSRYLKTKSNFKYECKCKEVDKDNNNIQSSTNCKGCRLQKCLSVGMKKLSRFYTIVQIVATIEDMNIRDQQIINSLLLTFEASIRIIHSFNDLDDIFLNGPILFDDIILSGFNIFNLIECFSPNPLPITYEEVKVWKNKDEGERIFKTRYHKWTIVDRLLSAAIAKSMPIFGKLSLSDQASYYNPN